MNIIGKIDWVGVNDRRKQLFENLWPLPYGVAYNSYIINDEKTALVDTIDHSMATGYLDRIAACLQGRPLDYLIINHMEPDHAGMIGALVKQYPAVRIIGNKKTFQLLTAYFGISENLQEITENSRLELGHHHLQFLLTPWVHWPETMMTYDTTEQLLFTGDAFGSFGTLDGGIFDDQVHVERYEDEALRYYSNIVGQFSLMVQKAIAKLKSIPVRIVCPTHGLVWRSQPSKIIDWYDRWSRHEAQPGVVIAFASMYGHTEAMADHIARCLAGQGIRDIRLFDVSKTHLSFLLSEIWKFRGVILGSCTYNGYAHPLLELLCTKLTHIKPKNKMAGAFGTYSWNGGAVNYIKKTLETLEWPLAADAIEVPGNPAHTPTGGYDQLAAAMAVAVGSSSKQ
ncbi:MAG: FprA family A-type flavoprotein [Prevotellaceae bacterium]|jgi:flavorubredoxin|nr:FprA family A-type flavoprotein [Prevotellaceae bacterium]